MSQTGGGGGAPLCTVSLERVLQHCGFDVIDMVPARRQNLDAKVVVITVDTHFTNQKWSEDNGFQFPVLSDYWPHGATAQAYDAFNEKVGAANRVTYVLDEEGMIRQVIDSGSLGTPREFDDYVEALSAID